MKIVFLKFKTLFTLVTLLTAFCSSKVQAQTEPIADTTVFYSIQTQSGKVEGRIVREDARELDCDVTATLSEVHHVSKGNFK